MIIDTNDKLKQVEYAGKLKSVLLYDKDAAAREAVDTDDDLWAYRNAAMRQEGAWDVWGKDYARVNGEVPEHLKHEPIGLCEFEIDSMKPERQEGWRAKLDGLRTSKAGKGAYYALYAGMKREEVQGAWDERKAREAELRGDNEAMSGLMARELPGYVAGGELSAELAGLLGKYGAMEELRPSLERGRAAFDAIARMQRGGDAEGYEERVQEEAKRLRDEYARTKAAYVQAGGGVDDWAEKTEEEILQQARANVGGSYEVGREQMRELADLLTDEKGELDVRALSSVLLALDADAEGQQTIDSKFLRNMVSGMKRAFMESADYVNRGNAKAGFIWQGADMSPVYLTQAQQDDFADAYSGRVEKLKNELSKLEDRRLSPSEKADFLAALMTDLGGIVGENVPFLATAPVGGWAGMAAGAAAMFPGMANREIAQAYADGEAHPELVGNVRGFAQAGAEGMFGRVIGGNKLVGRVLDKVAARTMSVPVLGKTLGAIQGNSFLRFAAEVSGESVGELFIEDTVADGVSCLTLGGLRKLGVDISEQEFQGFAPQWETFKGDPRQSAATVAYCAVMGLLGVGGVRGQARTFAANVHNLEAAGLKPGTARELSALAASENVAEEELKERAAAAYTAEVLDEDPVVLKKRLEENGKKFLEMAEVAAYARSGVRDYVLKQAGILAPEQNADGTYRVTRQVQDAKGEEQAVESNWTEEQLNAYVAMRAEDMTVRAMREFQARVQGQALVGSAQVDAERVKGEIVSLRELPTAAVAVMQKNGGVINYEVLEALSDEARQTVEGFVAEGMSREEAAARQSAVPNVSLGVLMKAARAFGARVNSMIGTAEGEALGIRTRGDASTAIFRLDAMSPGQSVLLYNAGAVSEREVVEDLIERDLVAAMQEPGALAALGGLLREVEQNVRRYDRSARFLPEKENLSEQDVIEGFSTLAQSRFLLNHARYNMPQEAHDSIEYVQKKLADAQHLVALSHAWDAFAKSDEGKQFIREKGASLEKLVEDAGASVAGRYAQAKVNADMFEVVRSAYEEATSPELARELHEQYEEEQRELDNPLPPEVPEPIPAEDSITGEEVSSEEQMGGWLFDEESGLMPPSEDVQQGEPGRGLVNGEFVRLPDGSVYGVAEVGSIELSKDVPQFKKKESVAGRVQADEDGTTHELSGGWNAKTDAIIVWRRASGKLEVISGRHRLAHAKKNDVKHIAVRVYDEDAEHDANWAKLYDVEVNILANTCNATDVAYYFRHNPMSLGEAEARGLMPKTRAGEQTAASRMGIEIAAKASDDTFDALINGAFSVEDVHMACVIAGSPEGQALALTERQGKNGKKQSWEYVTALVRGSEQMSGGGAMLDLFGWDTSFKEKAEKMARYVEAVRGQLKQRISVLASAGGLQRRADVAKREGVKAERPKDAVERMAKLAQLDAAYERMDAGLGIAEKADAWDGKSAVAVNESELDGVGASFSVFSPAEASGLKALKTLTQGKKEARFRSDTLGQDVILPLGSAGRLKDEGNPNSKVVGSLGFMHIISMRMAHGESLEEACYTACKAVMAAVNGQQVKASGNQIKLQLDGYSGVLIGKWENTSNAWVITGFKEDGGKSSADDRRRAVHLAASYAPDSSGSLKEVGAALDYAISRLAREYKQNNANPRRKVSKRYGETASFSVTDARARGLFKDGVMEAGNAVITEPSFSIQGAQHASPHRFKQFDLEHIGSGEGAQAYGWGVYFSENWGVNKSYHDSFSNIGWRAYDSKGEVRMGEVVKLQLKYGVDREVVWLIPTKIEDYDARIENAINNDYKLFWRAMKRRGILLLDPHAMNYLVDLEVEDGELMSWDEWNGVEGADPDMGRLSDRISKMVLFGKDADIERQLEVLDEHTWANDEWGYHYREERENADDMFVDYWASVIVNNEYTGEEVYRTLTNRLGSAKEASELLLSQGIKGIQYADGATRNSEGEKTYNYVIFDPAVIDIRKVAERKPWSSDTEDAGTWQDYGEWSGSFSVRGQASVLDRVNLREMAEEEAVVRLMNRARRGINRWRRVFAGDETGAAQAAQALGEVGSVMEAVLQYLPAGKRPHYAQQLQLVEAYARVIETGRVRKVNKEVKGELSRVRQELLNEALAELEKLGKLKGEARREMREMYTRQVAERRLEDVAIGMVEDAVGAMERYLVEREVGKLEVLAERLKPKKKANGKLARGKMSAAAYREFARLMGLVNMTQAERDAKLDEIQGAMATAEAERVEELGEQANELVMYGALRETGLVQARRGVSALVEYARTERMRWKEMRELEKARAKRLARLATDAMGGASEQRAAEQKDAEKKIGGLGGAWLKSFESIGQMWMGMEGVPALGDLARWSLDTLARGNAQLAMREQAWREKERRWMAEELGLDTERKRNNWMADMKRVEDTGVKRAGEMKRHRVRLTADEAREVVAMTKQEREERNEELRKAAEAQGVDAENIVLEDDVPLLKDELAKRDSDGGEKVNAAKRKRELTFDADGMSRDDARDAIKKLAGKPIRNEETQIEGYVNTKQRNKLLSEAAHDKSEANGFSWGEHNYVASRVDVLFRHATLVGEYNDKNGEAVGEQALASVKRFACPIMLKDKQAVAFLTVKEGQESGHRIYSVELETIETLEGHINRIEDLLRGSPSSVAEGSVARVRGMFKTYFEDVADGGRAQYVQTKREWREEAGKENMKMSRDEALNVILLCEQAGYAEAAADHGFTPEVLDGLRKYVGVEALRYGDFLRAGLDGNGLAAVYEAREGVPFPKVDNYWPGRFDQSSRVNENANALEVAAGMGTAYGMLITRVKHNLRFDLSIGATNSFRAAMAQQNNYIVMGELTSRWRKMLTHADFALAMKNHMGDTQFKTFKGLLNLIDGQGTQIAATETLASNLVSMMQSAHAMAVLSGAVPTLIKQVSAILNGTVYGGVGMWELLREVGRPGAASIKDIAELDCIKARFAGEEEYERMQKMGRNVGWSQAAVLARVGMDLIGKVDVWTNIVSMRALYNATYRRMKRRQEGAADALSEAEIRQECERVVQNALELGAQPLRSTQKAANLALGRSAMMRVLGYMGSETFNKLGAAIAVHQRNGGGVRGFWAAMKYTVGMSTAMQVAMMVVQLMKGDSPATGEDDNWTTWLLTNALTGVSGAALLQGVPIVGEAVSQMTGDYVKTGTYGQQLYDYQGAWRSTKKLWKALTGEKPLSNGELAWQLVQELRYATFLTALNGGVNAAGQLAELAGTLQSLNAVGNLVRPGVQLYRNEEKAEKKRR